jgi:hypothetical protein
MIATVPPGGRPSPAQRGGDGPGLAAQLAVGDRVLGAVLGQQHDVHAVGVALGVELEHLDQGRGVDRRGPGVVVRQAAGPGPLGPVPSDLSAEDRLGAAGGDAGRDELEELARGVGDADRLLGQAHAEAGLDAAEQLDALEAAEAEITLERGVEAEVAEATSVPDGGDELAEDLQQAGGQVRLRGVVGHAREDSDPGSPGTNAGGATIGGCV